MFPEDIADLIFDKSDPENICYLFHMCCIGPNFHTNNVLAHASTKGYSEFVFEIMQTSQNLLSPVQKSICFSLSCTFKHLSIVHIIASDPTVICNIKQLNPLHRACLNIDGFVIRYLLSMKRVDPNFSNQHDYTPMEVAVRVGNALAVRMLLTHQRIHIPEGNDINSIVYEAAKSDADCLKILLTDSRVHVNMDSVQTIHIFHDARNECIRLLLDDGRFDPGPVIRMLMHSWYNVNTRPRKQMLLRDPRIIQRESLSQLLFWARKCHVPVHEIMMLKEQSSNQM